MTGLESFRDSRPAEARASLPAAAAAATATAVAVAVGPPSEGTAAPQHAQQQQQQQQAASSGSAAGRDTVFPLVLALYAQQQRCRRQRQEELARVSKKAKSTAATAATAAAAGVSCSGGVCGVEFEEDDDDGDHGFGGFSARGVAAAAADGAAAVCGDWEGEAKALVRDLRDARRNFPSEVEFYLPQLCIVVALGDFVRPAPLVEFLLELCGSDLRLAHKTHWFLKSFCTGTAGLPLLLSGLTSRVQKRGCAVASRLSRAVGRNQSADPLAAAATDAAAAAAPLCDGVLAHGLAAANLPAIRAAAAGGGGDDDDGVATSAEAELLSPVVRVVAAAAGDAAVVGEAGVTAAAVGCPFASEAGCAGEPGSESPAAGAASAVVVGAAAAAVVVVEEEDDGGGDVRRVWQGDSSQSDGADVMGGRGLRPEDGAAPEEEEDDTLPEHYDPAMFFVEALLGLAEQLRDVSPKKRAEKLQEGLERINEFFLSERAQGSDVIYVPFRGGFHQIRAIHPRESMHFSTKERVPLLVCLEVSEVLLPFSLTAPARAAGSGTINAGTIGSKAPAALGGGGGGGLGATAGEATGEGRGGVVAAAARGQEAQAQAVEAEHAGEAGLMDRFRGTVRSFVQLQSEDGYPTEDDATRIGGKGRDAAAAASLPVPLSLPTRRQLGLGESIDGDDCSSRTASEGADLSHGSNGNGNGSGNGNSNSNPLLSSLSGTSAVDGGSPAPTSTPPNKSKRHVAAAAAAWGSAGEGARGPASPVPTASSLAALARAATASTSPTCTGHPLPTAGGGAVAAAGGVYCSSPEESDFGDDEGGEGEGGEGFDGGTGSQKGFWYGEGGGASALEAAMGQWGGDLDSIAAAAAAAAAEGGGGGGDDDTGSDTTAPAVAVLLHEASTHGLPAPGGDGPAAGAAPALAPAPGEGEDESWEIVNAPGQWEADAAAAAYTGKRSPAAADAAGGAATGTGGTGGADSQSDSYSEYLAAMEAERLDLQLAAEAEEEEAKRYAEAALLPPPGGGGTGMGGGGGIGGGTQGTVGGTSGSISSSTRRRRPAGRHYFSPTIVMDTGAAATGGGGSGSGSGGRKRGGGGGGGRRRRLAEIGGGVEPGYVDARPSPEHEQPRIIFKEQWREKEARVWHERGAAGGHGGFHGGFRARSSRDGRAGGSGSASAAAGGAGAGTEAGAGSGEVPSKGWKLVPIIVKANDDLRQEQFVGHLVAVFDDIFKAANLGARLTPYEIMATSPTAGVIEAVPDTVSLDALKRHTPHLALHDFFRRHFGRRGMLRQARANFVESCAAYSVVCYLLQIKDRHNGNLLLSSDGHLIHIDWGFALELSPGGNLGFESAPFKLTQEFVEVMGGVRSTSFQKYRSLCVRAFLQARRSRDKIITLVEMMVAFRPDLNCFGGRPDAVLKHLRARFQPDMSAEKCVAFVHDLIEQSVDNWRTRLYDTYQRRLMGIR